MMDIGLELWDFAVNRTYPGGQDKIILAETIDFMSPERDLDFSPGQKNIRMVALGFRNFTDFIDKIQGLPEILETKFSFKLAIFNLVPPGRNLR